MPPKFFPQRLCFPCTAQASDPDPGVDIEFLSPSGPDSLQKLDVAPSLRASFVQRIAAYPSDYPGIAVLAHGLRLHLFSVTDRNGTPYCAMHAAAYAAHPDFAGRI